jgi:hypothetical protein
MVSSTVAVEDDFSTDILPLAEELELEWGQPPSEDFWNDILEELDSESSMVGSIL